MLSPNALRILDDLGVYNRIRTKGYNFETLTMKNGDGETTGRYSFGSEKIYGYKGLRVYRQVILEELHAMIKERDIPVYFEKKFTKILLETIDGVTFQFEDGATETTDILVGADGIHSTIRQYIAQVTAKYIGFLAITSSIPTSKLRLPSSDYRLPVSISAKPGAFVIAPQNVNGEEVLVGTQRAYPEQDRAGWDALLADKQQLLRLVRESYSDWPDIARSALENLVPENLNIWPLYSMPRLESWASPAKRVLLVGDSAHAIPPSAGQGVNQAFEDAYSLALLLASLSPKVTQEAALSFWQNWRQGRIDGVLDLTRKVNNQRLPAAEQAKLKKEEVWRGENAEDEMRWLYGVDLKEEIVAWVKKQE